jgi:hypothetical protein
VTEALEIDDRPARDVGRHAASAPASPAPRERTSGTFAITFGIASALLNTAFERLNWPLFTCHPVLGSVDFWRQPTGVRPPMFWYGLIVLAAAAALVVAAAATLLPRSLIPRTTLFCCALAALCPVSLSALRIFIADWATFDSEFLDSAWTAAVPAFAGAAMITSLVSPPRRETGAWTSFLLIAPIGGLAVLCYSLQPYFIR